ncbi:MAG TPA: hypothetical protein VMA37_04895 [Acetobacteraceae bacterium]|nr:hypothetical protein [Acetobacteraceae bacterium]
MLTDRGPAPLLPLGDGPWGCTLRLGALGVTTLPLVTQALLPLKA